MTLRRPFYKNSTLLPKHQTNGLFSVERGMQNTCTMSVQRETIIGRVFATLKLKNNQICSWALTGHASKHN